MKKVVYAMSDEIGMFLELVVLYENTIIKDDIETEDGTYECIYSDVHGEDSFFYIEKTEV